MKFGGRRAGRNVMYHKGWQHNRYGCEIDYLLVTGSNGSTGIDDTGNGRRWRRDGAEKAAAAHSWWRLSLLLVASPTLVFRRLPSARQLAPPQMTISKRRKQEGAKLNEQPRSVPIQNSVGGMAVR